MASEQSLAGRMLAIRDDAFKQLGDGNLKDMKVEGKAPAFTIGQVTDTLCENGVRVVKFMLHVSREEQKRRLMERLADETKNWKFRVGDLEDRARWDDFTKAYEGALRHTSTKWAPWYVLPADHKWVARTAVAEVVTRAIRGFDLRYPKLTPAQEGALADARRVLEGE